MTRIEVKVAGLRKRKTPSLKGEVVGVVDKGIYEFTEKIVADGYTWYHITDGWCAKVSGVEEIQDEWEEPKPVEGDVNKFQVFVTDVSLNIRSEANTKSSRMGVCKRNVFYDVIEKEVKSDYTWYKLGDRAWVAGIAELEVYEKGVPRNLKELRNRIAKAISNLNDADAAVAAKKCTEYYEELNNRLIELNKWMEGKFDTLDYDVIDENEYDEIDLLYTADVHGAWVGYDENGNYLNPVFSYSDVGKYRDKLKSNNIKALLVDAGDWSRPCRVYTDYINTGVMNSSKEMNKLGYFASIHGNHEWRWSQYGEASTEAILKTSDSITICNLFKNGKQLFKPYRLAKIGSKRIAVIGIGYPSANGAGKYSDGVWTFEEGGNVYTFYDDTKLFSLVQSITDELKGKGVDHVIVVSHMCKSTYESDSRYYARTDSLIKNTHGLTAVIQGHYNYATNAENIVDNKGNSVLLAHENGANFNSFGRLKLKGNSVSSYLLDEQSDLDEI